MSADAKGAVVTSHSRAAAACSEAENLEDSTEYLSNVRILFVTIGLLSAAFAAAPGDNIIGVAIPVITTEFGTINFVGWYEGAYFITVTLCGTFYTFFDIKYTYLTALFIFEVGSIVCATAVNPSALIAGRAIAGAGASAILSGGMIILGLGVPLQNRPPFIALLSTMFAVLPLVGPLLGTAIISRLSWRWCFWINLPLGGLALITVFAFLKSPQRKCGTLTLKQRIIAMDLPGAFFLTSGMTCLVLGLQWGGDIWPWSDPRVWGCLLGFGLLTIAFSGLQIWCGEKSTFPPRILKQQTVAAGCIFTSFVATTLSIHSSYLPYFVVLEGPSNFSYTIPYWVSTIVVAITVGILITGVGYYNPFILVGSILLTVGSGMLSLLKVSDKTVVWIGYQLIAGIGAGACTQMPFLGVQIVLSADDMPKGIGLITFFNALAQIVSSPIADAIFSNSLSRQLRANVPGFNLQILLGAGPSEVHSVTSPELLPRVFEAYNEAIRQVFILPIVAASTSVLCSLAFQWKGVKGQKPNLHRGP